jgi:hypothetical protein
MNMDNMENLEVVQEPEVVQTSENVEQTTEQPPKMFTQEEVNDIVGKAKARNTAKIRKEYDRDYGELVEVLRAGTGKESVGEIKDTLKDFYQKKGVQFRGEPQYSEKDIEVLARAEAEDIINGGYEEVVEEVDRLAKLGVANMNAKDKATFKILAEHRQAAERGRELAQIGVTEDVYNSKEFQEFAGMFNPNTPVSEVYKLYAKTIKPQVEPIGSMKNGSHDEGKTFYTPEEVDKLTSKDLDNPVIFQRVRESMKLWK